MSDKLANPKADDVPGSGRPRRWLRVARRIVATLCCFYLLLLATYCVTVRFWGDYWWAATVIMYGPRWVFALPLAALLPAVALVRGRSVGLLALCALVLLGPVLGLRIPWRRALPAGEPQVRLRVLTCNVDGPRLSAAGMRSLIAATRPDVVMFQEWTSRHQAEIFADGEWHVLRDGELCIGSRHPIRKVADVLPDDSPEGSATCYEVRTAGQPVCLVNVHLMSPHTPLEALLERGLVATPRLETNSRIRRQESHIISQFAAGFGRPMLLAGDFNMPTDSAVYRKYWSGFRNAFCDAGFGLGSTYYTRLVHTRIDQILAGAGWQCRRAWVGPNLGSPHRPVIADLELKKVPDPPLP